MELVRIPYEELHGNPNATLALRALKAEPFDQLLSEVVWDETLLKRISEDALEHFLRHIVDADVDESLFLERIHSLQSPPLTPHTMTLAERLIQRGRNEGISQGEIRAMRAAILRTLELRHGTVPTQLANALAQISDEAHLQRLLESAVLSSSHDQFAQTL
jgi:hypothetical protein